jgi:hypothetical protein
VQQTHDRVWSEPTVDNSGQGKLPTRTPALLPTQVDPAYRGSMCSHPQSAKTQSTTDKRIHFRMGGPDMALQEDITQNEYDMRFCYMVNGIAKTHFCTQRRQIKRVNIVHFRVPKCRFLKTRRRTSIWDRHHPLPQKLEIKLSLCSIKHHDMKTWGVKVQLHHS